MPDIKTMKKIFQLTPIEQGIMVEGIHGLGKSEFIESYHKELGFRVVPKFLGQMTDAGDLIGLPAITQDIHGNDITKMAPPDWWPVDMDEKVVLFLDEINRAKPELLQAVMDLILNRKLNGLSLPHNCRIVASINPLSEDGFYEVNELGPALLSRFNIYKFDPTNEEWLSWMTTQKGSKKVMGFIVRHPDYLDPVTSIEAGARKNDIQQTRRGWKRASDIILESPKISNEEIQILVWGIVGPTATNAFGTYLEESNHGVSAYKILNQWSKEIEDSLKLMETPALVQMNQEISMWIEENVQEINLSNKLGVTIIKSVNKYLKAIEAECESMFFHLIAKSDEEGKKWGQCLFALDPTMHKRYFALMVDETQEKIEEEYSENE